MSRQSPFHKVLEQNNAQMQSADGWLVARSFGDPAAELQAAQETLAIFDLSDYGRLRVSGRGAEALLANRLGESVDLPSSERQIIHRNVTIGEKGISWLLLQQWGDGYTVICPANATDPVRDILNHQNAANVTVRDEAEKTGLLALAGPKALPMLREKLPMDLSLAGPGDVICETLFFMRVTLGLDECDPPTVFAMIPAGIAPMAFGALSRYSERYHLVLAGRDAWDNLNS